MFGLQPMAGSIFNTLPVGAANHDPSTGAERTEGGASILLNTRVNQAWESEALLVFDAQPDGFHVQTEAEVDCNKKPEGYVWC